MNNNQANSDIYRGYFAWLIILVLLFSFIFLFGGFGHLLSSISPNAAITPSTSMEPVELSFKYGFEKGGLMREQPIETQPNEWRLRLPRAFISFTGGESGSVYRAHKISESDQFLVFINTVSDEKTLTLTPAVTAPISKQETSSFGIILENLKTNNIISTGDFCIRQDDFDGFMLQHGSQNKMPKCTGGRCDIYTHLDGWMITLKVMPILYENPKQACDLAFALLNKYTLSRDSIR